MALLLMGSLMIADVGRSGKCVGKLGKELE